jgi:uncharacterized membrane protein YhaH (DUF805 family)
MEDDSREMDLLFSFAGRINRGEFWLGMLIVCLANFTNFVLSVVVLKSALAVILFEIPVWWILLAVCAKRLHDLDMPVEALIIVIPIFPLSVLILGLFEGTKGENRFGAPLSADRSSGLAKPQ